MLFSNLILLAGSVYLAGVTCSPHDVINSTSAADATRAIEQAGYAKVQVYAKGCDNAWHGHAALNGHHVNVVWNGEGQVLTEGN
jgi:hypothetical protein